MIATPIAPRPNLTAEALTIPNKARLAAKPDKALQPTKEAKSLAPSALIAHKKVSLPEISLDTDNSALTKIAAVIISSESEEPKTSI